MNSFAKILLTMHLGLCFDGLAGAQEFLPDTRRTNGADSLAGLSAIKILALASSVQVRKGEASPGSVTGVMVAPDGYILTLSSEIDRSNSQQVTLPDGTTVPAREIHRDERLNLLLLKIGGTATRSYVKWSDAHSLDIGCWLVAPADQSRDIRLGVVSARRRGVPDSGAVLGVRFGLDDAGAGVMIEEVAIDSPAEQAGLEAGDVMLTVDGQRVSRNESVAQIVSARKPGDILRIRFQREGKEQGCEVRLASKSRVLMNWGGEDFGNHGTSLRTDNFPEVLQHDLPLAPADMGGAVFDLDGRAVGLNVARVDRVTNYALPVEIFAPEVQKWILEDRQRGR